jgi:F-type H+-transporting ATPase subunit epsilon
MHLDIITPDQKVFGGEATSVTFPGLDGSFEVLNNHAPLIGVLQAGPIVVRTLAGAPTTFRVDGGVVEVLNNNVVVLAEALLA